MKVKILFFASARELAGVREVDADIPIPSDSTDGTLRPCHVRKYLAQEFPGLQEIIDEVTLAVNLEYLSRAAEDNVVLSSGDEVALIPPISGG